MQSPCRPPELVPGQIKQIPAGNTPKDDGDTIFYRRQISEVLFRSESRPFENASRFTVYSGIPDDPINSHIKGSNPVSPDPQPTLQRPASA